MLVDGWIWLEDDEIDDFDFGTVPDDDLDFDWVLPFDCMPD